MSTKSGRVFVSIMCGAFVGTAAAAVHWFIAVQDPEVERNVLLGDVISVLVTAGICLVLHLRARHARFVHAASGVTIVSHFGSQVCNAVLPVCIAAYKLGDHDVAQIADTVIENINIAVKDATASAFSG